MVEIKIVFVWVGIWKEPNVQLDLLIIHLFQLKLSFKMIVRFK